MKRKTKVIIGSSLLATSAILGAYLNRKTEVPKTTNNRPLRKLREFNTFYGGEIMPNGFVVPEGMQAFPNIIGQAGVPICLDNPKKNQPCLIQRDNIKIVLATCLKKVDCTDCLPGITKIMVEDSTCDEEIAKDIEYYQTETIHNWNK